MQESEKLILVGMVSGLSLPEGVNELFLEKARIFRNPAAFRVPGGPPEMGANTAIYSGGGNERHFVREVATYLIELESKAPGGQLGHTRIQGSAGVMMRMSPDSQGITLSTGTKPHSVASIAVPLGEFWDVPFLIWGQFQRAVLPLRLLTKARILVLPVGILSSESRLEMLNSGLHISCPEPLGVGLEVKLSADDCKIIEGFSKKLAKAKLADFEVPIFLFSRSFYRDDVTDRALDLITTLESLLSEDSESITYKLAFRASCLTSKEEDLWKTFRFAKEAYRYRSIIIHGRKRELAETRKNLAGKMEQLENLTRRCLTLACLLEIEPVRLPSDNMASMRKLELIDEYILTHCLKKRGITPLDSFPEIGKLWQSVRVL